VVQVKFGPSDYILIKKAAEARGLKPARYVRAVAIEAIVRELPHDVIERA